VSKTHDYLQRNRVSNKINCGKNAGERVLKGKRHFPLWSLLRRGENPSLSFKRKRPSPGVVGVFTSNPWRNLEVWTKERDNKTDILKQGGKKSYYSGFREEPLSFFKRKRKDRLGGIEVVSQLTRKGNKRGKGAPAIASPRVLQRGMRLAPNRRSV